MLLARLSALQSPFKEPCPILAKEDLRQPKAGSSRIPSTASRRMEGIARLGMQGQIRPDGTSHPQSPYSERQEGATFGLGNRFSVNSQGFLCSRIFSALITND
jgi:hypothetical protein